MALSLRTRPKTLFRPDPACFSAAGNCYVHYRVFATDTTPTFFDQFLPTVDTIVPEPGALGAGLLVILLMFAAKCRTTVLNTALKR